MPGVNLNLPIPSLSDTQTVVVTKIAQALTLIGNDLTPKVTAGELNINAALSFNGNAAINVGSVTFAGNQPPGNPPGTIYYANDGSTNLNEFFGITSAGIIKLTNNGGLNISTGGGIGGDYGTVGALVAYDNGTSRYRFFGAGAVSLVDLDARKLILEGTTATATLAMTGLTDKIINILSVPTSGVGLLAYNAGTNSLVDGTANVITTASTISAAFQFTGGLGIAGTITGSPTWAGTPVFNGGFTGSAGTFSFAGDVRIEGRVRHSTTYKTELPLLLTGTQPFTAGIGTAGVQLLSATTTAATWVSPPFSACGIRETDTIQSFVVRVGRVAAGTVNIDLRRYNPGSHTSTTVQSFSSTSTGNPFDISCTLTTPQLVNPQEKYWLLVTVPNVGDAIIGVNIAWTN